MMDRFFWGDRHYTFAENVREHLAHFQELEDIIALLGLEALSEKKRVLLYACARCSVISHNLSCDDLTTGIQGVLIKLDQTLADCEPFLHGDFDTVPEKHCDIRGSM